jgi:hypothetical protein
VCSSDLRGRVPTSEYSVGRSLREAPRERRSAPHQFNALAIAAGMDDLSIPETGEWALGFTFSDPELDRLWKAVSASAE